MCHESKRHTEFDHLRNVFTVNGYPNRLVRSILPGQPTTTNPRNTTVMEGLAPKPLFQPYRCKGILSNALSHQNLQLGSVYCRHEKEKRSYKDTFRGIQHGFFTPLVFSTSSGMGPLATTAYERLTSLIAWKKRQPYHNLMA